MLQALQQKNTLFLSTFHLLSKNWHWEQFIVIGKMFSVCKNSTWSFTVVGKSCENGRGYFFIVKIWKSVLELHMEPLWKCFGVVIMKWYEVKLNFEYWTSKFDFSHFQCPMVTHLKFEFFYNCFNIWFILSQLFVFISCYWPHVQNKTFCKSLD